MVSGHHQADHIQTEHEQICHRGVELTYTKGQSEKIAILVSDKSILFNLEKADESILFLTQP